LPQEWIDKFESTVFVRIVEQGLSSFSVEIKGEKKSLSLRSGNQIDVFLGAITTKELYLDITGLSHHVWAALLRRALIVGMKIHVVYAEPREYKFSATPTEGEIFDLSDKITGIAPLPGFVSLIDQWEKDVYFLPLLGFEGIRLAFMLENVQPEGGRIIPIIGVPGFMAEFPFHTYLGNKSILMETSAWKKSRYTSANCPFSLYFLLRDIQHEMPQARFQIAPIGTKPHALGAVLYACERGQDVELVYDYPIRKKNRSSGVGRILVYNISSFMDN